MRAAVHFSGSPVEDSYHDFRLGLKEPKENDMNNGRRFLLLLAVLITQDLAQLNGMASELAVPFVLTPKPELQ